MLQHHRVRADGVTHRALVLHRRHDVDRYRYRFAGTRKWVGGEVAQGGHRAGRVAGPQLGRACLLVGQAGDGADRLGGGLAGLAVGAPAVDLDRLAGSGEEEVVRAGGLDPANLRAAVADAPGASLKRDVLPGKGPQLPAQFLLVAFDDHDVVGASAEAVVGVLALGVHRAPLVTTAPARSATARPRRR